MKLIPISLTLLAASAANAQNPISADAKTVWRMASANIVKAAEKMPEESYAFKPSHDVRSFGQLVGHAADAAYTFCAAAKGEQKAPLHIEKQKSSKADLVSAIKDAAAYCNEVYDGMTDAKGAESVKFFAGIGSRLGVLNFNNAHEMEHYGNMVTYMRIRGIVPPSSEARR
jgi:uncharacterized damage-inducible protein DinB